MEMNYTALRAELDSGHPVTGAYNADDQLAADELNALNITRIKASMTGAEIFAATDATELAALTPVERQEWYGFCGIESVNPEAGGAAQNAVVSIFGAGSATVTALAAARQEAISRAQELDLNRSVVTKEHVIEARAL